MELEQHAEAARGIVNGARSGGEVVVKVAPWGRRHDDLGPVWPRLRSLLNANGRATSACRGLDSDDQPVAVPDALFAQRQFGIEPPCTALGPGMVHNKRSAGEDVLDRRGVRDVLDRHIG